MQHTEEGLYAVELGGPGQGAFGDDLAIEVLATEYQRDIYVVRLLPCPALWVICALHVSAPGLITAHAASLCQLLMGRAWVMTAIL